MTVRLCTVAVALCWGSVAWGQGVATQPAPQVKAAVVYSNDLHKQAGPEWSKATIENSPANHKFLGRFGNETVKLTCTRLPEHKFVRVSFDLLIIGSWDGSNQPRANVGPDTWRLDVEHGPLLLEATFSNVGPNPDCPGSEFQSFPDNLRIAFRGSPTRGVRGVLPGLEHPQRTGAGGLKDRLGYKIDPRDSTYSLSFAFPHRGEAICLAFTGQTMTAGIDDESWGLSNVKVQVLPEAPNKIDADSFDRLWQAMADKDSVKAMAATWTLIGAGAKCAPVFLDKIEHPKIDDKTVAKLIADLDSDAWKVREAATEKLMKMGSAIAPALNEALAKTQSTEVKSRLRQVLASLRADSQESLRWMRMIQVAEALALPESRDLLTAMAKNAPSPGLDETASAALSRLIEQSRVAQPAQPK